MGLLTGLLTAFRPISYPPVEKYADDAGVDIQVVEEAARNAFSKEGKIAAILAINELLGYGKPLPLPSTNEFVNRLKSS